MSNDKVARVVATGVDSEKGVGRPVAQQIFRKGLHASKLNTKPAADGD